MDELVDEPVDHSMIKRKLDDGKTLYEVAGMKALFEAAGLVEVDGTRREG
jgi:hypothetical protein